MKKIIIFLLGFLIFNLTVSAKDNKLYFTESKNRIYYESSLFDEKLFLNHTDMVPGKSYSDVLSIENGTRIKYTLYFQVKPVEQSDEANEFLEHILMKISLDGEVIYDGRATGLNYDGNVNLQNTIILGDFLPSKESTMVVETKLDEEYDNTDYSELSYVDWSFYAQYDDQDIIEIVKSPNTMVNEFPIVEFISFLLILVGMGLFIYAFKKSR